MFKSLRPSHSAKVGIVSCAALAAAFGSTPPGYAASDCFTPKEWQAAHVQALERQLQVAALECQAVPGNHFRESYQSFIAKFGAPIKANGVVLKAHFRRVGGRGYQTQMDQFITRIANGVSERSMHSMTFCGDKATADAYAAALAVDAADLPARSVDLIVDHSMVGELCPATQTAELKHRHHKKDAG